MKKITLLSALYFLTTIAFAQNEFIMLWQTTTANESITIPTEGTGYNYNIDWDNDGNFDDIGVTGNATHIFPSAGIYQVTITGDFPRIFFNNTGDKDKIIGVLQWGTNPWTSMDRAFYGCSNLTISAFDVPNLSNVTDMLAMFERCSNLTGNFGNWDVSNITSMRRMFYNCSVFNEDISSWNTTNVTTMSGMFYGCTLFNQNISSWQTGNVTIMGSMFSRAAAFNQPIGGWDVSNVTDMQAMFFDATNFNQDISSWVVSNVTNMRGMFYQVTNFNQDISGWNVGNVTDMEAMFFNCVVFNQPLGSWDVSKVTTMFGMFANAVSFNQDLGNWDISSVGATGGTGFNSMNLMFDGVTLSRENYDSILIGWNTLAVDEIQIPQNIGFNAGNSDYCAGDTARTNLINTHGWTITDGNLVTCTLSTIDFDMQETHVYPNPAKDQITIKNDANHTIQTVTFYDLTGRLVKLITTENTSNTITIDVSTLETTTYFVEIVGNQGTTIKRLIKE